MSKKRKIKQMFNTQYRASLQKQNKIIVVITNALLVFTLLSGGWFLGMLMKATKQVVDISKYNGGSITIRTMPFMNIVLNSGWFEAATITFGFCLLAYLVFATCTYMSLYHQSRLIKLALDQKQQKEA